jgi:hypothetical protein
VRERGLTHAKLRVFDTDGVLRGKYLASEKFESAAPENGFERPGTCSLLDHWPPYGSSAPICDKLKRGPIRDGDRCPFDPHPTRPLPFVQTLIDAFSCRSNDIAQLTLRHLNPVSGAAERLDIAHPEQRFRKSYWQLLQPSAGRSHAAGHKAPDNPSRWRARLVAHIGSHFGSTSPALGGWGDIRRWRDTMRQV